MRGRAVDRVGEDRLADGVLAVGDVGLRGGLVVVGQERVVAPDREQRVLLMMQVVAVLDPAHDQPSSDLVFRAGEGGVGGFGDFGVGDPFSGVGVLDGAGVAHRDHASSLIAVIAAVTAVFLARTTENIAPALRAADTTLPLPKALSPRTGTLPAPAARAVATASLTMPAAPLEDPVFPARSRIPATTGAAAPVEIVVASGDSPRRRTLLPAVLVWPKEAPCLA